VLAFALIVIVVLAAALWRQQQLVDAIGRESARRFNEIDSFSRDAQARARQALSIAQGNTDKLAVLESKVLESQSQQAALEQLYQELSRGEDEWTLIEVEQACPSPPSNCNWPATCRTPSPHCRWPTPGSRAPIGPSSPRCAAPSRRTSSGCAGCRRWTCPAWWSRSTS